MAETVEIVIKLPKKVYEGIQQIDRIILGRRSGKTIEFDLWNGVKNGIVLPKRHGRLIDADQLMNYCQNQIDGHKYADCNVIARFPIVLNAEVETTLMQPEPIIEEDKAESEVQDAGSN